ncbi:hypothetical protein Tco_0878524 [Tanacetum coccineum]|uniref:RRM domain-containing protein n=1 Tax=Tanacetum coccineum TaxID=301880 RepID=A0ABQ5C1J3_9ASTR
MEREREGNDGGWQKVSRKRKDSTNILNPRKNQPVSNLGGRYRPSDFDKVMRDRATSFFFTNFPDDWDTAALWRMFSRYKCITLTLMDPPTAGA